MPAKPANIESGQEVYLYSHQNVYPTKEACNAYALCFAQDGRLHFVEHELCSEPPSVVVGKKGKDVAPYGPDRFRLKQRNREVYLELLEGVAFYKRYQVQKLEPLGDPGSQGTQYRILLRVI